MEPILSISSSIGTIVLSTSDDQTWICFCAGNVIKLRDVHACSEINPVLTIIRGLIDTAVGSAVQGVTVID